MPFSSYVYLALGVFLLWFPRNWLRLGKRVTSKPPRKYNQAKIERDPHDQSVSPLVEGAKPRNWLDWFRALIGSWVITGVLAEPGSAPPHQHAAQLSLIGVLLVGVAVQMIRFEGRLSLFAPVFFLQGMTFGLVGGVVGAIAMFGSWALSPMLPTVGALLFVQGAATLCLALLLEIEPVYGFALAGLAWLPPVLAILLRKRLAASFDKKLKVIPRDNRA